MGNVEQTLDEFIEGMKAGTLSRVARTAMIKEFVKRLYLKLRRAGFDIGLIMEVATELLEVLTINLRMLAEKEKK